MDMSFTDGFTDELVKLALVGPKGEYTGPMAGTAAAGAILGGLTARKGNHLRDALITALIGAGIGAGHEYWRRRRAEKTASMAIPIETKEGIKNTLALTAGLTGLGGIGWGLINESGGLGKRLKAAGKWGLASAIGAPLATAIMNRDVIREVLKDKR